MFRDLINNSKSKFDYLIYRFNINNQICEWDQKNLIQKNILILDNNRGKVVEVRKNE